MKKVTYEAKGYVLGNYWGGGEGSYPTIKFKANSLDELTTSINKALNDGSIDSGMGYESLIGCVMDIITITSIEIDGKVFYNEDVQTESYGKLTEQQFDFLEQQLY